MCCSTSETGNETVAISEEEDKDQTLIQESQQVRLFQAGDHNDPWNRQVSITKTKIERT